MDVLLTNDDGYDSHGLRVLAAAFRRAGHVVHVVAPNGNRSASSHAITLFTPLVVQERAVPGMPGKAFAVGGTPTDCGKLALSEILRDHRPDLVVSGINLGANLGANIFYSGTIGGAFEGVLAGIPAAAISVEGAFTEDDATGTTAAGDSRLAFLDEIADLSVALLDRLLAGGAAAHCRDQLLLYNINFPKGPPAEFRGVRIAPQGREAFIDAYEARVDPRGRPYYWLSGIQGYCYPDGADPQAADDLHAVTAGYVAITPLRFDLNCADEMQRLRTLDLNAALAGARETACPIASSDRVTEDAADDE